MRTKLLTVLGGLVLVWTISAHIRVGMSLPPVDMEVRGYSLSEPGVYHSSDSTAIIIHHDTMRVTYDAYGTVTFKRQ